MPIRAARALSRIGIAGNRSRNPSDAGKHKRAPLNLSNDACPRGVHASALHGGRVFRITWEPCRRRHWAGAVAG